MAKRARSQTLPGIEKGILELEELATQYADVRDRRMELNREETGLKTKALELMKRHHKTAYKRDGIEILLVPGEETIKVKVAKHEDEEPLE